MSQLYSALFRRGLVCPTQNNRIENIYVDQFRRRLTVRLTQLSHYEDLIAQDIESSTAEGTFLKTLPLD